MKTIVAFTLVLCVLGCEPRDPSEESPFQQKSAEFVLLVAIDMSGSFQRLMTENGKAYEFILRALDQYNRDGAGSDFQVIITQLSGNNRPLLWQGTPRQLRRDFPNPKAFRDYMLSHADTDSSRIYDGIAESLDYALHTYSVAKGGAKTVALILSDMRDNHDSQGKSDRRMIDALAAYARRGAVGFYFCDQQKLADVRQQMRRAGIDVYNLECDIHGRPPLPAFDW